MPAPAERDRVRRAREAREAREHASAARRRRVRLLAGSSAAVVVAVAVVVAFGAFKPDPAKDGSVTDAGGVEVRGAAQTAALLRGLPQDGVTLGRKDAPVTILEIADLKCPSCKAHEIGTQPQIVDRLVRTGRANLQLQLVNYRDGAAGTIDGEAARRAAYNLVAANRFWSFVDATWWNQGSEQETWATEPFLRAIAAAAPGIGPADVNVRETPASRSGAAGADRLAEALGTRGTPTLYVLPRGARTGTEVPDPDDVDALDRAVTRAAKAAR